MDANRVSERTIPQISVRLSGDTKAAFVAYVDRLRLEISQVVKLLILRERRLRRLAELKRQRRAPRRVRQARGKAVPRQHVTVYFESLVETAEFDVYATSCSLKPTDALAWLIEAETAELWLERALKML